MDLKLDWSAYKDAGMGDAYADIPKRGGDFSKAVAVCINSRQCETSGKGVMCPSYRVTNNSLLSTGGRVVALKRLLNSDDETPISSKELDESMALCVGCKGCKRECENSVDIAMIKVEYLAQQHAVKKPDLRTRFLANTAKTLNRRGLSNLIIKIRNKSKLVSSIGEKLIGISMNRKIPEPAEKSFFKINRDKKSVSGTSEKPEVVLLIDTFTNNFAPQIATAAISVLEKAGYHVETTDSPVETDSSSPLCCGRTLIANGMVDDAKREATRMISALLPHVDAGRAVIGLEPACLLAIRDDYNFLGLGEEAARVSKASFLFEEFIAKEIAAKRFDIDLKPIDTNNEPLLIHGHCHQKAVGAMKSMRRVLKKIPELDFKLIESSCCGMAGSFGIEKEHAEISMEMAEQSLLPTLREHPNSRVLANGFSCRHQIDEGLSRSSQHLATLLEEAIA